ncbi:SIS domain-containing protein [bacterium]|nr:SIS domain-containing protein [bacterium]
MPVNALFDPGTNGSIDVTKSAYTERLEGYCKIIYDHTRPKPEDIFIIISNSGRNPIGVDLARTAQENGHNIELLLTSLNNSYNISSRHSSGKRLLDYVDVILVNCGELGDICIKVDWMKQGLGPTSTMMKKINIFINLYKMEEN